VAAVVRTMNNVMSRSSSGSTSSEEEQEQARRHRKEVAEEDLRLSNERQAARQRAMDEYERRRVALAQQIETLERSNNHGVNNTAIEELIRQRAALPLPQ
jgi:U3 small nucleolar ribonucleoprotein component